MRWAKPHVLLILVRYTAEAAGHAGPHTHVPGQVMRVSRGQVCARPYAHADVQKSAEPESCVSAR